MLSNLWSSANHMLDNVKYAMMNPFGIEFEIHNKKIYIPLGSAINALGYNDHLERIIGISRLACGLIVLATGENKKTKLIAAAHIFRGALEMVGNFERELLVVDLAFTVFNLAKKTFSGMNSKTWAESQSDWESETPVSMSLSPALKYLKPSNLYVG